MNLALILQDGDAKHWAAVDVTDRVNPEQLVERYLLPMATALLNDAKKHKADQRRRENEAA